VPSPPMALASVVPRVISSQEHDDGCDTGERNAHQIEDPDKRKQRLKHGYPLDAKLYHLVPYPVRKINYRDHQSLEDLGR
jgi:hypothetical protein